MKTLNKTILAVLATGLISCALFSQQAQASPMLQASGNIGWTGTVELNTPSAGTATAVTAWHGMAGAGLPLVFAADGSFAGTIGMGTTFVAPYSFVSGAIPSFWTVGGFIFNLTESHIFSQGGNPPGVVVNGSGFVSGNGFTSTFMTWSFSTQDPPAGNPRLFTFSASAGTVPDSGSTVALLGLALAGVEALRRKMSR
jgi:hypothetical protein